MKEHTDEIREQVRKKCENIELEQKKFLEEQRKLQEEMIKKSDSLLKSKEKRMASRSEARIRKQFRLQVGFFSLPIFVVVTMILLFVLHQVGYDFARASIIRILIVSLLLSAGVGALFYFMTKTTREKMVELSNGLEAIANGDMDHRLDATKAGVLTKAYIDYNEMAEKLKLYRQSMNEAVEEAERANRAKSDFLSNMSHEIRTPMNAIVGMTDILLRTDMQTQQREYLMNIKNSGAALLTIINDILDISKIESGKMEIVCDNYEPMSMFNDLSMIFLNRIGSKPVELIYDIDTDFPSGLYGDALRIRQILINLANNAIKFTEEGSVTLKARITDKREDEVAIAFEIIDTGQGIKEEDLEKLFGAFSQVDSKKNHHKEGTGLGLSISKQLVELMGGNIGVRSTYGQGSCFYFTIVQKVTRWEPIEIEAGPQVIKLGSLSYGEMSNGEDITFTAPSATILVVDDNEMNLKVAKGLLEPLKMNIETAENGKEAVRMVQEKDYDIIFMDHMMPVMDGLEATACIRESDDTYHRTVPIVALTANAVKEDREKFFEAGMNDFVSKPIDFKEICACIRQWLPEKKIVVSEEKSQAVDETEENKESSKTMDNLGVAENPECEVDITPETPEEYPKCLDHEAGIKAVGSKKLYLELLGDFYKIIDLKSVKIEKTLQDGLINDYTIEVHALKNTSRMIGDLKLSEEFKQLEELGKAGDEAKLKELTPDVLDHYRSLKPYLRPYAVANDSQKEEVSVERIGEELKRLHDAIDAFDLDEADAAMKTVKTFKFPYDATDDIEKLDALLADVAMEDILSLTEQMIDKVKAGE